MKPFDPRTQSLSLRWTAMTHTGKLRLNNEDTFLALTFNPQGVCYLGKEGDGRFLAGDYVFAVSDGMGGAQAGEFASRITVEKITRLLPKGFKNAVSGITTGPADLLQELFHETHKALTYLGTTYEECSGMGATLSLCWFGPTWLYFGHIGDSRLYYFPAAGGMKQLSQDDSHVGWLLRNNRINEREARTHPLKNSVQKALGAGHQFVDPQVGAVAYEAGDLFLLCSDGVIDGLWDRHLLQLLREPTVGESLKTPAKRLVEAALENSGRDNITAVVVEVVTY
jgi:PPM family protein phosphatase